MKRDAITVTAAKVSVGAIAPELMEALREARASIAEDRQSLYECHADPRTGRVSDELCSPALAEYDALLARIDAALEDAACVETITWRTPAEQMPDSDTTVLIAIEEPRGDPVWSGYWDGNCWRTVDGWPLDGVVKGWADMPAGPQEGAAC